MSVLLACYVVSYDTFFAIKQLVVYSECNINEGLDGGGGGGVWNSLISKHLAHYSLS